MNKSKMHDETKKKKWMHLIKSIFFVCCVVIKELPGFPPSREVLSTQVENLPLWPCFSCGIFLSC